MYSITAQDERRCTARTKSGGWCMAWATWNDPHGQQVCVAHGGKRGSKPVCHCQAYKFPHRPGGGLCQWPDEPLGEHPTPAGTHKLLRIRAKWIRDFARSIGHRCIGT